MESATSLAEPGARSGTHRNLPRAACGAEPTLRFPPEPRTPGPRRAQTASQFGSDFLPSEGTPGAPSLGETDVLDSEVPSAGLGTVMTQDKALN